MLIFKGVMPLAFEKSKGMLAIATSYSGGSYGYTKLDKFVGVENITITPDIIQDIDSFRNQKGKLKRKTMPCTVTKIEINTAFMPEKDMDGLTKAIESGAKLKDGKCIEEQRKVKIRYYNSLRREYDTAFTYIPDISFTIYSTSKGYPEYNPVRIAFIGYGEERK